jgi:hypothetical protein
LAAATGTLSIEFPAEEQSSTGDEVEAIIAGIEK